MKPKLKTMLLAVLIGLTVFCAIVSVHVSSNIAKSQADAERLERYADQIAARVTRQMTQIIHKMRDVGTALRFNDPNTLSPTSTFHDFVRQTRLLEDLPTISGVRYLQITGERELALSHARLNGDRQRMALGYPLLSPGDAPGRGLHATTVLIEPLDRDMRHIGTDMLTQPLQNILMRSIIRRAPQASTRFRHFTGETGVAIFVPVLDSPDALLPHGVVSTVVRVERLMRDLEAELMPLGLKIEAHELGAVGEAPASPGLDTVLALSRHTPNAVHGALAAGDLLTARPDHLSRTVEIAGQRWELEMAPIAPPAPVFALDTVTVLAALVASMAALLYFRISNSAEQLARQVEFRTRNLAEVAETLANERAHAEHAAHHDELTGLLNRRGMRVAFEAHQAGLNPRERYAVISVDLDRFKQINDTEGHHAGDALLKAVAAHLRDIVPPGALVARFGGDEFVIVLAERGNTAERIGQRFLDWSRVPQMVDGLKLRFGACLGIAFAKGDEARLNEVLANADIALYAAKDRGRDQICVFDQDMRKRAVATKSLADDLKRALDDDEFVPFFQTQHDAVTHELRGLETLVRWQHPDRGILPPGVFLDVAESSGLLQEIDRRTMHKAAKAIADMERAGHVIPKFSVNISFDRLQDPDLRRSIEALPTLRAGLGFEILEAVFLDEIEDEIIWQIDRLKESGVQIEVDDFGSGRASIIALTRLAPHRLKIDRGLVQPLFRSPGQERLLSSIVDMGRALDIGVTAEGVETAAHGTFLRDIGVDTLQGYHFSKPISAGDVLQMLETEAA